jgi:predicted GH43/DUF377 family glycosyl hydrolase
LDWVSATVPTPRGCIELKATPKSLCFAVPADTILFLDGISYVGPTKVSVPVNESTEQAIDADVVKEWSAPYRGWHYYPFHVIPAEPAITGFEGIRMTDVPTVYQLPGSDNKWYMSFIGFDDKGYQSFVAESHDLINWTNLHLAMGFGKEGDFDFGGCVIGAYLYEDNNVKAPRILKRATRDGKFWTLFGAYARQGGYELDPGYEGVASSNDGLTWNRAMDKYILSVHDAEAKEWEKGSIYQPWLVEHEGTFYNFYNAKRMPEWIEQIGMATCVSGNNNPFSGWHRDPDNPVLRVRPGGFDARFVADGKVFRDGDHWVMFYYGLDDDGGAHIMVAFSRDLHHWTADPEPLYKAGGNPSGLDKQYAHKISLVWNPANDTWYMYYCAVGNQGRGIGLITSKPVIL